jgi:hypothetical protein
VIEGQRNMRGQSSQRKIFHIFLSLFVYVIR